MMSDGRHFATRTSDFHSDNSVETLRWYLFKVQKKFELYLFQVQAIFGSYSLSLEEGRLRFKARCHK